MASVRIFGVRHHGPGSARSLLQTLTAWPPDVLLVEGPPDAAPVLPLALHADLRPPVALLIYVPEDPQLAVYYPFAIFSPELQAIRYGLERRIPVRFMDLPQTHQLALAREEKQAAEEQAAKEQAASADAEPAPEIQPTESAPAAEAPPTEAPSPAAEICKDPLGYLAAAAGYSDGERWWEHMVEQRRDSADLFAAILEAMTALREAVGPAPESLYEARREAWMRQTIRAAEAEGFERIAVVCGAWHGPALAHRPPAADDAALLKGLPKIKVQATWVPWTNGHLLAASGYGAGIESPGWYAHLWESTEEVAIRWLTRVARLLREQDLDASAASVIEAVRLAEALAALRDRPLPGLPELNEATQAVLCFGSDMPMRLIEQKLIVGEVLGHVPDETPMVPLQQDLQREQKRLRLPPEAVHRDYDFDLRQPTDLARSHLLHRLNLLGLPWGTQPKRSAGGKGTFHELWRLQWQPEFVVSLIESSRWGNTIEAAAATWACEAANQAADLPALTKLLDRALLANLPGAVQYLVMRVQAAAAVAGDVMHLMDALPALVNILRYGNVRDYDPELMRHIVDGLVARICIGLPGACASLNDEAAAAMFTHLANTHSAVTLLQNPAHLESWQAVLGQLADQAQVHGLVAGRCVRLLLDQGALTPADTARRLHLALSTAGEPLQAAAWVEGLLKGSGLLLLHNENLWTVVDEWVTALAGDIFTQLLPLLRRTFATFTAPERRQMGERVRYGLRSTGGGGAAAGGFDETRAQAVLPLVAQLLGLAGVAPGEDAHG